jgi:hypothetical protein
MAAEVEDHPEWMKPGARMPAELAWIGVDLDGTLAEDDGTWHGETHIGAMVARVRAWLRQGTKVKIFTARAMFPTSVPYVEAWSLKYLGQVLPVTNIKDHHMVALWDDRAVRVVKNTGEIAR